MRVKKSTRKATNNATAKAPAQKTLAEMPEMLTDSEVAQHLRMSTVTLRKHLREGPPRKRARKAGDIRLIQNTMVGGVRRWSRDSLAEFLSK
jgi:hypothetical protein